MIYLFYRTTEKEDMINKYNRVLTSSLLALRKLLTSLPTNQIEDLKEPLRTLLADGKFWKHGKSTILSVLIFNLLRFLFHERI